MVALDCEHERQSEAGITRTARQLAAALERRGDIDLLLLGGGPLLRRGTPRKRLATVWQDLWWYPRAGRSKARAEGADVYHCPATRGPSTRGRPPLVVTIHDLASFRFPETVTPWTRRYEKTMLPRTAAAADLIIAPSNDTATDVELILKIPSARIRIVPQGVDVDFFSGLGVSHDDQTPYVLFVGTPQPRKNLQRLVEAMEVLWKDGSDLGLLVAGSDGWGDVRLDHPRVSKLGRVSDDELRGLYQRAACVALVSLHEGFGLPALEAMAAGAPLVAAATAALPELVGDAAVLVDPLKPELIAAGIIEAISRTPELREKGRARVRNYTWSLVAERTVAVYRELV